ncbi:MAG: hypothetical protein NVSMB2_08400 [Chloroflexota bacterium]
MIFDYRAAAGRNAATRAGWNDAAWGGAQRRVDTPLAAWYGRGYAGGRVFRRNLQADIRELRGAGTLAAHRSVSLMLMTNSDPLPQTADCQ